MDKKDFTIENGILKKYNGADKAVVIPDGVTSIDGFAIRNCKELTSVTLPDSVTSIGDYAFYGCHNLASINIPNSVTSIGEEAFVFCENLTSITFPNSVTSIGKVAFRYCKKLTAVNMPNSITSIDAQTFSNCESLTSITISDSVTCIAGSAFDYCNSLEEINVDPKNPVFKSVDGILYKKSNDLIYMIPQALKKNVVISWKNALDEDFLNRVKYEKYTNISFKSEEFKTNEKIKLKTLDFITNTCRVSLKPYVYAYLYLFQSTRTIIEKALEKIAKAPDEAAKTFIEALADNDDIKVFETAADFIAKFRNKISDETVAEFCILATSSKTQKILDNFGLNPESAERTDTDDRFSELHKTFNEGVFNHFIQENKCDKKLFTNVKLNDGTPAPEFVVKCAIVPYMQQYEKFGRIGDYQSDYLRFKIVPEADKAAEFLDKNSLCKKLRKYIEELWGIIPLGRYGRIEDINLIISKMNQWRDWNKSSAMGRWCIITARGALILSDTREALFKINSIRAPMYGVTPIEYYASLRGTSADILRDKALTDFGLDEHGSLLYDLGTTTITATFSSALEFEFKDNSTGKVTKSVPKKNSDPARYEAVKSETAKMQSQIKKVIAQRSSQLFELFLNGAQIKAAQWKNAYLEVIVLRRLAEIVVWSQDGKTFIVTENGTIDSEGNEYIVTDKPIIVAHPMDMAPSDIKNWQQYFISRKLKQPFLQVWEPVVNFSTIRENRYAGIKIPYSGFINKGKHGIHIKDYDFHNEIEITLDDCSSTIERLDNGWNHEISGTDNFEIKSFMPNKTRMGNHITAYFDKITIIGIILNNDASLVEKVLPTFTFAQIMEFINVAAENKCTEVTALLLEYKNKNFPHYDPLDRFTLD